MVHKKKRKNIPKKKVPFENRKTSGKKEKYFDLLKETWREVDSRYVRLVLLEIIFLIIFGLSLFVFKVGLFENIEKFQPLSRMDVMQDPSLIDTIDINPFGIIMGLSATIIAFFTINLFNYTFIKEYQYRLSLKAKPSNNLHRKRFFLFNLVWWLFGIMIFFIFGSIIVFSFLMGAMMGFYSGVYFLIVLMMFVVFSILGYFKMIANIHFFIDRFSVKDILRSSLKIHKFLFYVIAVDIIWLFVSIPLFKFKILSLIVFTIFYSFFTSFGRVFFIKLIQND